MDAEGLEEGIGCMPMERRRRSMGSFERVKIGTAVTSATRREEDRSGCDEDRVKRRSRGRRHRRQRSALTKEEDKDLVCKQATTTTGPLSVSRAFEEMTKERQQSGDRPVNKRRCKRKMTVRRPTSEQTANN